MPTGPAAAPATAAASTESPQANIRKHNEDVTAPTTTRSGSADEGMNGSHIAMTDVAASSAAASPSSTSCLSSSPALSSTSAAAPAFASSTGSRSDTTSSTHTQPLSSSPSPSSATEESSSTEKLVTSPSDIPSKNPIKLRLVENFLTAADCEQLIAAGESKGFWRSSVFVASGPAFIATDRTSYSSSADQYDARILQRLRETIFHGGEPFGEAELGLVRYEPGQQYKQHYDSRLADSKRMRQYTIFVYLNDVDSGGETWFPHLDLKVKPQRGAALVWENHASRDTEVHDEAKHAGLPPTKSVKYGLNIWLRFACLSTV